MSKKDSDKRITKPAKSARDAFEKLYGRFSASFSGWGVASGEEKQELCNAMQRVFDVGTSKEKEMKEKEHFVFVGPTELQDTDAGLSTQRMLRSFYGHDASPSIIERFHTKWFHKTTPWYRNYIITLMYRIVDKKYNSNAKTKKKSGGVKRKIDVDEAYNTKPPSSKRIKTIDTTSSTVKKTENPKKKEKTYDDFDELLLDL